MGNDYYSKEDLENFPKIVELAGVTLAYATQMQKIVKKEEM
jgi:hypothetical protein